MIIKNRKDVQVKSNLQLEGYDTAISSEDMHKLWDMLQDPYKNPIGAVVREYVSNSFDAHAEVGVQKPVHVRIAKEESGWYWSTEDFGVGMSPERVRDVFSNYLKSTKENTNDMIGAFGIGSKSGLSYTEVVEIRTRFEGVEYNYLLRKGEQTPRIDKLFEQPTEEGNGTRIRIRIRTENSHLDNEVSKFINECKTQLCYFDNVFFETPQNAIENDYKIYRGNTFLLKNKRTYSAFLHLVIGKVGYPIDWNNLGISPIEMPFALKFDIGELDIIQTREDVKYTERTIKAIKTRLEEFKEEIKNICREQWPKEFTNIFDYVDYAENNNPIFRIEDSTNFYIGYLLEADEIKSLRNAKFIPLVGTMLEDMSISLYNRILDDFTIKKKILNGRLSKAYYTIKSAYRNGFPLYRLAKNVKPYANKNKYIGNNLENGTVYLISKLNEDSLRRYKRIGLLSNIPKSKWREVIKLYQKTGIEFLLSFTKSYDKVVVPKDFIESQKNVNKIQDLGYINYYKLGEYCSFSKSSIRLKNLEGNTFFVLGDRTQKDELVFIRSMLNKRFINENYIDSKVTIGYTSKENLKLFENVKNYWSVEKMISKESKLFVRTMTSHHIRKHYKNVLNIAKKVDLLSLYEPMYKLNMELEDYIGKNYLGVNTFIDTVAYPYALENNVIDKNIVNQVKILAEYFSGLEILEYLESNTPIHTIAELIMRYNKSVKNPKRFKKLNTWFYINFNETELKWLKENEEDYKIYTKLKKVS